TNPVARQRHASRSGALGRRTWRHRRLDLHAAAERLGANRDASTATAGAGVAARDARRPNRCERQRQRQPARRAAVRTPSRRLLHAPTRPGLRPLSVSGRPATALERLWRRLLLGTSYLAARRQPVVAASHGARLGRWRHGDVDLLAAPTGG